MVDKVTSDGGVEYQQTYYGGDDWGGKEFINSYDAFSVLVGVRNTIHGYVAAPVGEERPASEFTQSTIAENPEMNCRSITRKELESIDYDAVVTDRRSTAKPIKTVGEVLRPWSAGFIRELLSKEGDVFHLFFD